MKTLNITDDSGFMGIANFDTYRAYVGEDWDFDSIRKRIIEEMNARHLLFWSTGSENKWKMPIFISKLLFNV